MQLVSVKKKLSLSKSHVMGILNVTPDSFFDGGRYQHLRDAVDHTASMINCGATIIDVGGESTRPGADIVSEEEEIDRVIPVVTELARRFDIFISVNTSKARVIRESAKAGADMINDIRSLNEPGALQTALKSRLAVCLMHMQGNPKIMQQKPHYTNVVMQVHSYLKEQIERCEKAGIARNQLLIDPGFGFGKTLSHNYQLLARLDSLHYLGVPLLVGVSRKSMIGDLLKLSSQQRAVGSIACAIVAALKGAKVFRVHDVEQTVQALRIVEAVVSMK